MRRIAYGMGKVLALIASLHAANYECFGQQKEQANSEKPGEAAKEKKAFAAFLRGQEADKVGDLDKAISCYDEALALNPALAFALNARGTVWQRKGEADKAVRDFTETIRLVPKASMVPYVNRGNAWRQKGQFEKAIADFTSAIEIAPGHHEPWYARGNARCEKGDFEKGIKDFDEAIRLNPSVAGPHFGRGRAWDSLKDYDKAVSNLTEAIKLSPRRAEYYAARAESLIKTAEFKKAEADYTRAINLKPVSIHYMYRALTWHALKEYQESVNDFEQAVKLDPKNDVAICALSFFLSGVPAEKARNGKRALELAKRAYEIDNKSPMNYEALASAHAELRDFQAAIEWQRKATQHANVIDPPGARRRLLLYENKLPNRTDGLFVLIFLK